MNSLETVRVREATSKDFMPVVELLQREGLPVDDVSTELIDFFVIEDETTVVAAVGLETYEEYGLLRSMVVDPQHRNKSLAATLLNQLLFRAVEKNIKSLYLITTTAEKYFLRKGFVVIDRERMASQIKSSVEFSTLCPSTSTVMVREL